MNTAIAASPSMKHFVAIIASMLSLMLYVVPHATSQSVPTNDSLVKDAKNTLYVELATILAFGTFSINYERMLTDNLSLRVGLGASYFIWGDIKSTYSNLVMLNVFTAGSDHKLEAGVGASLIYPLEQDPYFFQYDHSILSLSFWQEKRRVMPAFAIGYRYQQSRGGFFYRAGITYTYFMGMPVQISVGHTF